MATRQKTRVAKPLKKIVKKSARTAAQQTPLVVEEPEGPPERIGLIEIGGKLATVIGNDILVGQKAPEFTAQANDWSTVQGLASTVGKVRIIAAVPSLSTNVCDRETRAFDERAADLGEDVRVLVISTDLPPTQKVWCAGAGVTRAQTLSDHIDMDFGIKYGTYIKERRWHRRAVFVIDKNDRVTYAVYMPALNVEPNYDEVLAAAKAAIQSQ